ncbi:MAG: lysozyme [Okeania sp. SIO2C2]|uniref:lysozyme n=1 Tax=Okeania sp. SIO2C2 TaxID=2607787 RepID=UPI0013B85A98|nr:hypothetical protein [Okeania sp. SIO2C2]NEP90302.1 lysozyme [Okeania sp. SIO2C2]
MEILQNCLNLVKKWEGLFLNANLDPVGIPTIGYGTIRYPNGKKVQLGERITERNAEFYLKYECDKADIGKSFFAFCSDANRLSRTLNRLLICW